MREPTPRADHWTSALPPTEQRNPRSEHLDDLDTLDVLHLLHAEDAVALEAAGRVLSDLAPVVDLAADRLRRGGTVHYFGAGTSGRLGVLDASELRPTFNVQDGTVVGHIAGGVQALVDAVEDAEDSVAEGRRAATALGPDDVAIGLAASGSTPYVGGALQTAGDAGAYTVLISSNPEAGLAVYAETNLVLETGAEIVTGSTRLKAGTAQKLVLNGFSTALMIATGRTWKNLMVSVVASNAKLRERTVRILCEATGLDEPSAREVLHRTEGDLKASIVATVAGVSARQARTLLDGHHGFVGDAIAAARDVGRNGDS